MFRSSVYPDNYQGISIVHWLDRFTVGLGMVEDGTLKCKHCSETLGDALKMKIDGCRRRIARWKLKGVMFTRKLTDILL